MNKSDSKGERSIALFLLGILFFNPPLLSIFAADVTFGGIPLLYLYLFCAWAAFILLIGLMSEKSQERRRGRRAPGLPLENGTQGRSAVPEGSLPHSITPHLDQGEPLREEARRPEAFGPDSGSDEGKTL